MLHAYFCSLDEGVKKPRPEALKSMKIELRGPQNPFEKQLQSDTASEEAFEPQFFRKFVIFFWFFGLQNEAKIQEKMLKMRCLKTMLFLNRFLFKFSSIWPPKMEWKFNVFWIFIEKADFVKIIVFLKENCYFSGFELPKIDKISMSKRFRKWHRKKRL